MEESVSGGEGRTSREVAPPQGASRSAGEADAPDDRLLRITAAIADAVTTEQVYEAIVDRVGAALEATSAGLWLVRGGGTNALRWRSYGYSPAGSPHLEVPFPGSP